MTLDTHDDLLDDDLDARQAETFALLERTLPRVVPSNELFDRILGAVEREATVVPLAPARARRQRRAWLAGGAAAVAAVMALAIGISLSGDGDGLGDPDARAAITSQDDPSVSGEAELFADEGKVLVSLASVPQAPSGHHYEVWVLPEGSDEMISVGTFDPQESGSDVTLELDLPAAGRYAAVDVSVEEDAGPSAHSDTSYGTGTFA